MLAFRWANYSKELCVCVRVLSCVQLFFDPITCSPPGSSDHGILQTKILEWVAITSSKGCSPPRDQTCISCIGRQILYHWPIRKQSHFIRTLYNNEHFSFCTILQIAFCGLFQHCSSFTVFFFFSFNNLTWNCFPYKTIILYFSCLIGEGTFIIRSIYLFWCFSSYHV